MKFLFIILRKRDYFKNNENIQTAENANIPITAVVVVHTRSVDFISRSENLVTTQKKASFECEINIDPAPIAKVASTMPYSLFRFSDMSMGEIMEAAVMTATVDEPWAVLRKAAIRNGTNNPSPVEAK